MCSPTPRLARPTSASSSGCLTRDELLEAAYATPLEADPGIRTEYSDIGFIILGEALARLADEPLDSFCHREIFGPLGMATTCFNPPPASALAHSSDRR